MEFVWNIDPVLFRLGPLQFRYYGLLFLVVFLGGVRLFRWQVERLGGSARQGESILITGVVSVLVGARLGHVFFYEFDRALSDPLWIVQFWKGGLASHGATLGLIVGIYIWSRRHRQSYLESLDCFSYAATLSTILVRVGNFFNSEIVGRQTGGDWGVRFPRYDRDLPLAEVPLRHPSQLYEALMGVVVMLILFAVDRATGGKRRPRGLLISTFFLTYFTGRFTVEFFKEYQTLASDSPLTMGQILSIPAVLLGLIGVIYSLTKAPASNWTPDTAPSK